MFSSVTSWLGGVKPEDDQTEKGEVQNLQKEQKPSVDSDTPTATQVTQPIPDPKPSADTAPPADNEASKDSQTDEAVQDEKPQVAQPSQFDEMSEKAMHTVDEMSVKAANTAKEWGSYLYSFGKAATDQVTKSAMQFKETVEEKTIIGDFHREQNKFVNEKEEKKKQSEAAVPPWVGYIEEESMKSQIMALSSDKRNFLRNPPSGVQFQFDFENSYPIALATLPEDPKLEQMRFELVPKQVNELTFWRNYFYRVSLIKQSAQLTSLAQQTGNTGEATSEKAQKTTESAPKKPKGEKDAAARPRDVEPDELPPSSPPDHEFISDAFQSELSEEDLKKEMQQLGMEKTEPEPTEKKDEDIPEWEKELQAELQEYEVVDDGNTLDDADLEQEILKQIEAEAQQQS